MPTFGVPFSRALWQGCGAGRYSCYVVSSSNDAEDDVFGDDDYVDDSYELQAKVEKVGQSNVINLNFKDGITSVLATYATARHSVNLYHLAVRFPDH